MSNIVLSVAVKNENTLHGIHITITATIKGNPNSIFTGTYRKIHFHNNSTNESFVQLLTIAIKNNAYKIEWKHPHMFQLTFNIVYDKKMISLFLPKIEKNHLESIYVNMTHTGYDFSSLEMTSDLRPIFSLMQKRINDLELKLEHATKVEHYS